MASESGFSRAAKAIALKHSGCNSKQFGCMPLHHHLAGLVDDELRAEREAADHMYKLLQKLKRFADKEYVEHVLAAYEKAKGGK